MYKIESNGLLLVARQPQPAARARVTEISEEAVLVKAVRHGEQEAFARLYSLYAPMVHGIVLARVPWSEVDDLVQDVFLVALKKLNTLRDDAAFGGWLAMIARNRAMDFHRRRRETEELNEDLASHSRRGTPRRAGASRKRRSAFWASTTPKRLQTCSWESSVTKQTRSYARLRSFGWDRLVTKECSTC